MATNKIHRSKAEQEARKKMSDFIDHVVGEIESVPRRRPAVRSRVAIAAREAKPVKSVGEELKQRQP